MTMQSEESVQNEGVCDKMGKRCKQRHSEGGDLDSPPSEGDVVNPPTTSLEDALKPLITSQIRDSFVEVKVGLANLLKQCVLTENLVVTTAAALCRYVDHFQSKDDEDLGWGCGWRNIQILCSFLLAERPEAREVLFNGAGFVPDIPALQRWLEIAWMQGFDQPGAEYFDWVICGTTKWIGTTECATLLRSFGIRARIVSFSGLGNKRARSQMGQKAGSASSSKVDEGAMGNQGVREEFPEGKGQIENQHSPTSPKEDRGTIENQGVGEEPTEDEEPMEAHEDFQGKSPAKVDHSRAQSQSDQNAGSDTLPNDEKGTIKNRGVGEEPTEGDGVVENCESCLKVDNIDNSWSSGVQCDDCGKFAHSGSKYRGINGKFNVCSHCRADGQQGIDQELVCEDNAFAGAETDARDDQLAKRYNKLPSVDEVDREFHCNGCGHLRKGNRYDNLRKKNFRLCSKCMHEVEEWPNGDKGSPKDYVVVEKFPARRRFDSLEADGKENHDHNEKGEKDFFPEEHESLEAGDEDSKNVGETDAEGEVGQESVRYELLNEERGKVGTMNKSDAAGPDITHHHLIEWVWSYFTEDPTEEYLSPAHVLMSNRSPLYFQHRGHSRTIVGIERQRKGGVSEDIFLLVLDPSQSSKSLVEALRKKTGWQKLIKHDVRSLKEQEYQLCYADPGVAAGEELEQLKVLSSSRYSYYSR